MCGSSDATKIVRSGCCSSSRRQKSVLKHSGAASQRSMPAPLNDAWRAKGLAPLRVNWPISPATSASVSCGKFHGSGSVIAKSSRSDVRTVTRKLRPSLAGVPTTSTVRSAGSA